MDEEFCVKKGIDMQAKVAVFGILKFPPDRVPEVLPHLKKLVETTYKKDGCIAYDVSEDVLVPGT